MAGSLREPGAAPAGDHVAVTPLPLAAVTRVTSCPQCGDMRERCRLWQS